MFKLFNLPYFKRGIVATLLLIFISNIILPTVSWALTSGPTAPEATSFEPVDTTDMVNLATGDFTYNMPLLEVPGPAGGYPLSLSYHAGIQTNEEASWVGLGWTLNPGAITRNVIGYPDDHKNVENVDRTFWVGGKSKKKTFGISYGIAYGPTVSAGLSFSEDTYKGFGVGGYYGAFAGVRLGGNLQVGLSTQVGVSPYGNSYSSTNLGVSASIGNVISAGVGVGINHSGAGSSIAGFGTASAFGVGASIDTQNKRGSVSIGGGRASVNNSKSGNVSSTSSNLMIEVPLIVIPVNLKADFSATRYWIDETANVATNGSLYFPESQLTESDLNKKAFDVYDLKDITKKNTIENNLAKELGGTFPSYDKYNVTAQGLSGSMRPYLLKKQLLRQNIIKVTAEETTNEVISKPQLQFADHYFNSKVAFRFENDFSNKFMYDLQDFGNFVITPGLGLEPPKNQSYNFAETSYETHGENGADGKSNYKLFGSKNIEWFTNSEINKDLALQTGLRLPTVKGFNRSVEGSLKDQIGAFMITNNSGVNYHYALPAYSQNEYMESENYGATEEENGYTGNKLTKNEPYAYTWFLTSITGPDYYDANENGYADNGDWGYWVNFEYGFWSNQYKWRNPGTGYNTDIDSKFRNYSYGYRDVYYLNYIKTQTHTAAFVKEFRADAKGVINKDGEKWKYLGSDANVDYYDLPVPSLGLDHIILYKNSSGSIPITDASGLSYNTAGGFFEGNVLDILDISGQQSGVIKKIQFNHNYNLAKGTYNSFDPEGKNYNTGKSTKDFTTLGKYTLSSIQFLGKDGSTGSSPIPPTYFYYDKNPNYHHQAYDSWGFYKSDYNIASIENNENFGRLTSDVSSANVDAWSLSRFRNAMGAVVNINYESDKYSSIVLQRKPLLKISNFRRVTNTNDFILDIEGFGGNLSSFINTDSNIDFNLIFSHEIQPSDVTNFMNEKGYNFCDYLPVLSYDVEYHNVELKNPTIVSVSNSLVVIRSTELLNKLNNLSSNISANILCDRYNREAKFNFRRYPDVYYTGVLNYDRNEYYGGGIRVASIHIGNSYVKYDYNNGTTPYEPFVLPKFRVPDNINEPYRSRAQVEIDNVILESFHKIISNSRELPGPSVLYSDVEVRKGIIKSSNGVDYQEPGYNKFEFQPFQSDMVAMNYEPEKSITAASHHNFTKEKSRKLRIKDYSNRIGLLKKSSSYDALNHKTSETIHHYLHDDRNYISDLQTIYKNQGLIEEAYSDIRVARIDVSNTHENHLLAMLSKKSKYPVIATGVTEIDYEKGIKQTTHNLAFDFYSGEVTKTLTDDGRGNYFMSENIPAYRKYGSMGLKSQNASNYNMLTQSAGSFTYHVSIPNINNPYNYEKLGLVSASANTWIDWDNSRESVWRKRDSYNYVGLTVNSNGFYPISDDIENFYWDTSRSNGQIPATWERMTTIAGYDKYSHPTQVIDQYLNRNSALYGYNDEKIIASGSNILLSNLKYAGFEDYTYTQNGSNYFTGNMKFSNAYASIGTAHTGTKYLTFPGTSGRLEFSVYSKEKYVLSFWVRESHLSKVRVSHNYGTISGAPLESGRSNGWVRCETLIDNTNGETLTINIFSGSGIMHIDDVLLKPVVSQVSAYVYNEFGELTHIIDNNNLYTRFEYDAYGRLTKTFKETLQYGEVQVSENSINFGAN